ncbi:hypothetical protein B0I00_2377 [Novosphingobium kunmingense]|uniref:GDT1 family protein n=1 Tax=Novosphingobium kunmingense TaxID=1211806 RepID=A0A2N0H775_9SPHN|nr:hypothetical protein [Novosphingobium kunmingense]PKB14776.1 hypothetical protein B0I00_2377 [Novosphingobium kunmingense]
MAALLFSLMSVLLVGLGARDQLTLAALTARHGARPALLIAALTSAAATIAIAIWASDIVATSLTAPARTLFLAIALGLAGAEMLVLRRASMPLEPTNSLGAFAVVLLAQQLTDAARFVVLGLAVYTRAPLPVAMGAGVAAAVLAVVAWLAAEKMVSTRWTVPRRVLGIALLAIAAGLAFVGLGRV